MIYLIVCFLSRLFFSSIIYYLSKKKKKNIIEILDS